MNRQPLITVIIPVYNIKEYLPRCVKSVSSQTYDDLEIILVDDGSTDGTSQLCDKLAAEDMRIRVYHKKNGGSSSARNAGLMLAEGSYIGFVDSDDYIEPDMYEKLYAGIKNSGCSIAQAGRDEIDEEGRHLPDICVPPDEATKYTAEEFLRELLLHKGDCSFCTKLFKREVFENRSFHEGKLNEDFRLLVQMLADNETILSLPDRCYHVFYRQGSNSRKKDKNEFSRVFADSVDNADDVAGLVDKSFPGLAEVAFRFGIFQRLEYLLHIPIPQMNRTNAYYMSVVKYLRHNYKKAMRNRILTKKNKVYLTLFVTAPKTVRVIHKRIKRL